MENELRENLLRCAAAYAEAKEIGLSTLGRLAAGDWRFFDNLSKDDKTFTARKYDEVVQWFSDNWPVDKDWPVDLTRPEAPQAISEPERTA